MTDTPFGKIVLYVLLFVCLGFIGFLFTYSPKTQDIKVETGQIEVAGEVSVKVSGCVNKYGTYKVKTGTKVKEVIDMAGGVSKNGDITSVNVDEIITEPCNIYIKKLKESKTKTQYNNKSTAPKISKQPKNNTPSTSRFESASKSFDGIS